MTGLTVDDVFTRVKRTFGDEAAVQVTTDDITRWINDAQREAVMQMPGLLEEIAYINAVSGVGSIDIPDNLYTMGTLYYRDSEQQSYYMVKWLNLFNFNQHVDGWDGGVSGFFANGVPVVYTRQKDKIVMFPPPQHDVVNGFKLEYARHSTPVASSLDAIDLPEHLHTMVVNFCLAQAYEMDEDWESSQIKGAQVQGDINMNADREAWFGRETYPVISTSYADDEPY